MLRDTAYATVKEEMDEDFERCCEEIQESRKKRGMFCDTKDFKTCLNISNQQCKKLFFAICFSLQGCSSSKYAPSYYHVMPKENSVPACKKTDPKCNEKMKMPAAPVDCSTPRLNGKLHFIPTFLEKVLKSWIPSLFL